MFLSEETKHIYSSIDYPEPVGSPDIIHTEVIYADWAGCPYIFKEYAHTYTHTQLRQ